VCVIAPGRQQLLLGRLITLLDIRNAL
jgi:hypothetical protein